MFDKITKSQIGKAVSLALIAFAVMGMVVTPVTADHNVVTVDDDGTAEYQSIEEAVEAASDGATVNVSPGVYYDSVDVNTGNLTIQNADPDNGTVYLSAHKSGGTEAFNTSSLASNEDFTLDTTNFTTYNKSVITVGDSGADYLELETAEDNAKPGTVIKVQNGTYDTSVNVTTSFIMFEPSKEHNVSVTVNASDTTSGKAFLINANHVTISEEITTINAVLSGGGGSSGSSIDFTQTFFGIPLYVIILALLAIAGWFYSEKME